MALHPKLPPGRKWSDYEKVSYMVANPVKYPEWLPKGLARFFIIEASRHQDNGFLPEVDGRPYALRSVWLGEWKSMASFKAQLDAILPPGKASDWIADQIATDGPFAIYLDGKATISEAIRDAIMLELLTLYNH